MILDRIENYKRYPLGEAWEKAFQFLKTLTPETADGRYDLLDQDRMFAKVMTYNSIEKSLGKPEAHNKYIDIQCTLAGAEGMYVYDRNELKVQTPYNNPDDVEFYQHDYKHEHFVSVFPREFAVFFHTDAHMPQMKVAGCEDLIRKVVIKVRRDLLSSF